MRRLTVLLAMIGVLVAASFAQAATPAQVGESATAQKPAVRVRPPDRALLVSDSAWLGIYFYGAVDSVQGFDHTLALASCRRRVTTSCTNYNGFVPITLNAELDHHGTDFSTLIVATGYNDSDVGFTDDVDTIVSRARAYGYQRIVWLTLRSNVSYTSPGSAGFAAVFERNNATLQTLVDSGAYPDVVIADWATYARDQPEWFAGDGIHLRRAGPFAAGDYISRKMAFLDELPCPQPMTAGQPLADPCPDPDAHGPVVDLASLYPIGEPFPPRPFLLNFEGSSSWPNPAWWE